MEKAPIKKFAMEARRKLMDDVRSQLGRYGITANGILDPHTVTENELIIDLGNGSSQRVSGKQAIAQYRNLVAKAREFFTADKPQQAIDNFCEEWAYTWFNRLIAIRFMEVNRYIPVRVLSSEIAGQNVPDLVKSPFSGDLEFTADEKQHIYALQDANDKEDDIFRFVFFKQCNDLNRILPRLFENLDSGDSFSELLVVLSFNDPNGVVYRLVNEIDEKWFNIYSVDENGKPVGQVQIMGWMYQYYNTDMNDLVYDGSMSKSRLEKELVPAATTIYTPDWAAHYMVENSLGRLWSEGHPGFDKSEWKYYLDEAPQEPQIEQQLEKIRTQYAKLEPYQIKVIDPCMGSGHILCYLFDVLMQIYLDGGYSKREAVRSILENNLFGLDISKRAAQIAYFSVMMKAREYDSGFFDRRSVPQPKVYEILESNGINRSQFKFFGNGLSDFERNEAQIQLEGLLDTLTDAKEYGSILNMDSYNWELLRNCAKAAGEDAQVSMESIGLENTVKQLKPLIDIAETMGQEYDVVVTNPPYLGSSRFSKKLDTFVKDYYPDVKFDLSMVMLKKALDSFAKPNGFVSFITTTSWMFLSSFEKLRNHMFETSTIDTLVDFGTELFDGKVGHNPIVAWVNRKTSIAFNITAIRLVDYCYSRRDEKEIEFFNHKNYYTTRQDNFSKIPGSPVAYWVSDNFISTFIKGKYLAEIAPTRKGMFTGNNDLWLKFWFEINSADFCQKFMPYNKGGEYRKWYGNNDYVVNWNNSGKDLMSFKGSGNIVEKLFFKPCLTWSLVTSYKPSFRAIIDNCHVMGDAGPIVVTNKDNNNYLLGLLNSKYAENVAILIAPTINFSNGAAGDIPVIYDKQMSAEISNIVSDNISASKSDWDSFETSWDFEEHPLV